MPESTKPSRAEAFVRGTLCKCPKCGETGLLASFFKLKKTCTNCGLSFEKEEGFTLGTTSIGYVISILLILVPMVGLAIFDIISTFTAVIIGGALSIALPIGLYPLLLGMVVGSYYALMGYDDM